MLLRDGDVDDAAAAGGTLIIAAATVAVATQTSHTGPILAFVGALLVAFITAREARKRQRRQLDHDREMRALELSQSRQVRDTEHLRGFLDEAIAAFEVFIDAVLRMVAHGNNHGRDETFMDLQDEALSHGQGARIMGRRMDIRFDPNHPVRAAYTSAVQLVHEAKDAVSGGPPWTPEQLQAYNARRAEAMQTLAAFAVSAQTFIGARLEETEATQIARRATADHLARTAS